MINNQTTRNYTNGEFRTKAVIGCKLNRAKLFIEAKVKVFDHDYPESVEWGKSGEKLWATVEMPIKQYDPDAWPRRLTNNDLSCRVIEAEDGQLIAVAGEEAGEVQLISTGLKKAKCQTFPKNFSVVRAKKYLRDRLKPLGLWDEETFGFWTVITCC